MESRAGKLKDIVIDGKDINSRDDFHDVIKKALNLPEYYGRNLDALWDCLTCDVKMPIKIIWINYETSKKNLGDYCDRVIKVLNMAEENLKGRFKFEIR